MKVCTIRIRLGASERSSAGADIRKASDTHRQIGRWRSREQFHDTRKHLEAIQSTNSPPKIK